MSYKGFLFDGEALQEVWDDASVKNAAGQNAFEQSRTSDQVYNDHLLHAALWPRIVPEKSPVPTNSVVGPTSSDTR